MESFFLGLVLSLAALAIYAIFFGVINSLESEIKRNKQMNSFKIISHEYYHELSDGSWDKVNNNGPYFYEKNNRFLIYSLKAQSVIIESEDNKYKLKITHTNNMSDSEIEILCYRYTPYGTKLEYKIKIDRGSKTLTKYFKESLHKGKVIYKYA